MVEVTYDTLASTSNIHLYSEIRFLKLESYML